MMILVFEMNVYLGNLVLFFFPLPRQNPKDVHTLAQLISAYSLVDPEKAKVYPFEVVSEQRKRGIWALVPSISAVWRIQTHSHLKAGSVSRTATYPGHAVWSSIISLVGLIPVGSKTLLSLAFSLRIDNGTKNRSSSVFSVGI